MSHDIPRMLTRRRRLLPRFSLRTLALAVLLAGSGFGLWWRWEPWVVTRTFPGGASWSPDGEQIIVSTAKNSNVVQDVRTGAILIEIIADTRKRLLPEFSTDGSRIIGYVWPHFIERLFDSKTGRELCQKPVSEIRAISPSGQYIVLRSDNSMLDFVSGKQISRLPDFRSIAWSRKGDRFAIGCEDGYIRIVRDQVCNEQKLRCLDVCRLTFSPDETLLAAIDSTGLVRIWSLSNLQCIQLNFGLPNPELMRFSSDSRWLAVTSHSGANAITIVCDVTDGSKCTISDEGFAAFSPDRRRMATGADHWTHIRDLETGAKLCSLFEGGGSVFLSADELLTSCDDAFRLWHRRRPEYWWGIAWLPEFWLTLVFGCGLGWSVGRERRERRKVEAVG